MITVLFDLEGTLVQSMEDDHEAIHEIRIKTREKLVALGIPRSELKGVTRSTIMRNKAFEYVKEHFDESKGRLSDFTSNWIGF